MPVSSQWPHPFAHSPAFPSSFAIAPTTSLSAETPCPSRPDPRTVARRLSPVWRRDRRTVIRNAVVDQHGVIHRVGRIPHAFIFFNGLRRRNPWSLALQSNKLNLTRRIVIEHLLCVFHVASVTLPVQLPINDDFFPDARDEWDVFSRPDRPGQAHPR